MQNRFEMLNTHYFGFSHHVPMLSISKKNDIFSMILCTLEKIFNKEITHYIICLSIILF